MSTSHYGKSRSWAIVFFILQIFLVLGYLVDLTSAADRKDAESARELASSAYYQIDGNRFDRTQLAEAFAKLDQAAERVTHWSAERKRCLHTCPYGVCLKIFSNFQFL